MLLHWAHNFIDTSELEELISAFPMAPVGLYVTNEVRSAPSLKRHKEQVIPAFILNAQEHSRVAGDTRSANSSFNHRIRSKTPNMTLHKMLQLVIHFFLNLGCKECKSAPAFL